MNQYKVSTEPISDQHRLETLGQDNMDSFIRMARNADTKRFVFEACDVNKSGYIELEDLEYYSQEYSWTRKDCEEIFKLLDYDGDGKVSYNDFLKSSCSENFVKKQSTAVTEGETHVSDRRADQKPKSPSKCRRRQKYGHTWPRRVLRKLSSRHRTRQGETDCDSGPDEERPHSPKYRHSICLELSAIIPGYCNDIRCNVVHLSPEIQEHVIDLYQQIHQEYPHLLPGFEKIILDVIRDIRIHQQENERLEISFKREKEQHDRHLRHLEEEMEAQMQRVEQRVRKEERVKMENEKEELRYGMEIQISELQQNLNRLQKIEDEMNNKENIDDAVCGMRERMEALQSENRYIKSELTDAQTNLALLRSELASLRQQYEDKQRELVNEKSTLQDYIREQENLSRQLHLLHDANKRLHDTNDDLRAAIEVQRNQNRKDQVDSRGSRMEIHQRGSVVGQYFSHRDLRRGPSVNEELLERSRVGRQMSCDRDSLPDDFDSGHSTLRDVNEFDSEIEGGDTWDRDSAYGNSRMSRSSHHNDPDDTEVNESFDEYDTEVEYELKRQCSRSSSRSKSPSLQYNRSPSVSSTGSHKRRRRQNTRSQDALMKPVLGEPERMYKVVFAGDCAVGKSSFIMRLCKNKFLTSLNSTLGVDFQTKTVEVDGHVIALQLWDTAGQERFRSIAKSYFRRADGVLLLYDCTYERSFINLREWLETIEDGAEKKIPVMIVGNKTDLREEAEEMGRRVVKEEDGHRLARTCDGLFIETSAKDGSNIMEAVTELARMLRCNEDVEVQTAALQLGAPDLGKTEKKSACCS